MEWYIRKQIMKIPPAEQIELARKAKAGDEKAKELLIRSMLALIMREISSRFTDEMRVAEDEDFAQSAAECILIGIQKYDPDKGIAFSTYIYYWIRLGIDKELYASTPGILMGRWRRKAVKENRKQVRYLNDLMIEPDRLNFFACHRPTPEQALENKQRASAINEIYTRLPARQKKVALMHADLLGGYNPQKSRANKEAILGVSQSYIGLWSKALREIGRKEREEFTRNHEVVL